MARWPHAKDHSLRETALCGKAFHMKRRLGKGTVLRRDASYDGALYERNRFVYPLISVPLLMPINGEFLTVRCAF